MLSGSIELQIRIKIMRKVKCLLQFIHDHLYSVNPFIKVCAFKGETFHCIFLVLLTCYYTEQIYSRTLIFSFCSEIRKLFGMQGILHWSNY